MINDILHTHNLAYILAVIISAFILSRLFRWLISKSFVTASKKIKVDPTNYKFLKNAVSLVIWVMAFAVIVSLIPKLKALAITLFAGAGILVAIIGFAAQQAFSNIISGIFIVISKPFRVGDMIKIGSTEYGIVDDITLRHTVLLNFENKRIIIPNSIVSSEKIINDVIEDKKVCRWVEVGISYDSDVDLASEIIQSVAMEHPKCIDVRTKRQKEEGVPCVEVRLVSFQDSSMHLRAYVWTDDPYNAIKMHSDINKKIKKEFDKEGVEIPFPYRTLVYKDNLPQPKKKEQL